MLIFKLLFGLYVKYYLQIYEKKTFIHSKNIITTVAIA